MATGIQLPRPGVVTIGKRQFSRYSVPTKEVTVMHKISLGSQSSDKGITILTNEYSDVGSLGAESSVLFHCCKCPAPDVTFDLWAPFPFESTIVCTSHEHGF